LSGSREGDPFAPQLLIDYSYFCNRFGPLPFGDFVAMWRAADALMQAPTGAVSRSRADAVDVA